MNIGFENEAFEATPLDLKPVEKYLEQAISSAEDRERYVDFKCPHCAADLGELGWDYNNGISIMDEDGIETVHAKIKCVKCKKTIDIAQTLDDYASLLQRKATVFSQKARKLRKSA
jgi:phage FluMu protein Com